MRFAIYFTPPAQHPLTLAAATWLGRTAFGSPVDVRARVTNWSNEEHRAMVTSAARYGFHATLKAPFSLAPQYDQRDLLDAFDRFEPECDDLVLPSLQLRQMDGFFALVPSTRSPAIQDFAASVVQEFDRFRAPLTEADYARRNPDRLTERQRDLLRSWGYPYVFEEFFFHMTLTDRISEERAPSVRAALETHFSAFLDKPLPLSHIAIFTERLAGEDFHLQAIRPIGRPTSA